MSTKFIFSIQAFRACSFKSRCVLLTFRLAVSAVFVVVLSQQFGQDGLMLLIQFLGFFSFRASRHVVKVWRDVPACAGAIKKNTGSSADVRTAGTSLLRSRCTAC